MATCSKCRKDIGFFSRTYSCIYCGKTLCKNCISKLEATYDILNIYRLLDLPHADAICAEIPFIHTRKDGACSSCAPRFREEVSKISKAINSTSRVELLPATYHGKRNIVGDGIIIESGWYQDWTNCDWDLIVQARYLGRDCVMKIEREQDTETVEEPKDNGKDYYKRSYAIWKKRGIASKSIKDDKYCPIGQFYTLFAVIKSIATASIKSNAITINKSNRQLENKSNASI